MVAALTIQAKSRTVVALVPATTAAFVTTGRRACALLRGDLREADPVGIERSVLVLPCGFGAIHGGVRLA